MVEYNYDAWGNFVAEKVREVSIGSVTVDLVSLNAFTYRGYYYDKESGLYYLINRYYAPTTVWTSSRSSEPTDTLTVLMTW